MESELDCLLGQFDRTLWISDAEAALKVEKSGGVVEGEGECGDDVVWLLLLWVAIPTFSPVGNFCVSF